MGVFSFIKGKAETSPEAQANASSKDVLIFDYLKKLGDDVGQYRALYLYTNKLKNQNSNSLSRQALIETFSEIIRKRGGELFSLPNENVLIIFNLASYDEIRAGIVKIKFLFHDDPLMRETVDLEHSEFIKSFNLIEDIGKLKALVLSSMTLQSPGGQKIITNATDGLTSSVQVDAKKLRRNLSPAILAKLQKSLEMTDFTSLIRRQSICAIIGKSQPQVLFDEVFVSIADLRDTLLPDVDLMADPWLFQALTETLDKGVLTSIARHDDGSLTSSFSLNLNVSTILSDIFLEFDESISPSMRSTIVLELQLVDIFSDVRAFNLAKLFAQSRGYKICIDGITVDKLQYINRSNLEADLIKIIWHPSFAEAISTDKHFTDYVNKAERAKMILCRVDDENAVELGNSLGINLYQGRYVQKLLSALPKKVIFDIKNR